MRGAATPPRPRSAHALEECPDPRWSETGDLMHAIVHAPIDRLFRFAAVVSQARRGARGTGCARAAVDLDEMIAATHARCYRLVGVVLAVDDHGGDGRVTIGSALRAATFDRSDCAYYGWARAGNLRRGPASVAEPNRKHSAGIDTPIR